MKLPKLRWLLAAALIAANAWSATPQEWKDKLKDAVEKGLQPQTVAELRTQMDADKQAGGADLTHFDLLLDDVQDVSQTIQQDKASPVIRKEQIDEIKTKLESILSALDMKPDAALVDAYIGQLAPPPEAQAEINKRIDDLNKRLSEQGRPDAYRAQTDEIKGFIADGNWKEAYAKFHSTFDNADDLPQDAKGDVNIIDRTMKPRPAADANEFTEYRRRLRNGMDMIDVPAPYSADERAEWNIANSGEHAGIAMGAAGAGATGVGVASAAGVVTVPGSMALILLGLGAAGGGFLIHGVAARERKRIEEEPEDSNDGLPQ